MGSSQPVNTYNQLPTHPLSVSLKVDVVFRSIQRWVVCPALTNLTGKIRRIRKHVELKMQEKFSRTAGLNYHPRVLDLFNFLVTLGAHQEMLPPALQFPDQRKALLRRMKAIWCLFRLLFMVSGRVVPSVSEQELCMTFFSTLKEF